jgi:lipoate-protein ligase A
VTVSTFSRPAVAWEILSTPSMSGSDNMAYDLQTLLKMQHPQQVPVLRFFRWRTPGASFGKHQTLENLRSKIPAGMDAVQRPTGGGLVMHGQDLCLSLCWRQGQPPLPTKLKDHYAWIHGVIAKALAPLAKSRLANCRDCSTSNSFSTRDCFTEPVAFDVLRGQEKIVGGALCHQKDAFLYQGSIQGIVDPMLESTLRAAFQYAFSLG